MDDAYRVAPDNAIDGDTPTTVIARLTQSLLTNEGRQQHRTTDTPTEYLFFNCGAQRWGAHLKDIWQIVPSNSVSLVIVPLCPTWVMGAFQTEMQIATMIHLAGFMKIPPQPSQVGYQENAILIVKDGQNLFGLQISSMSNAYSLSTDTFVMVDPSSDLHRHYPYAVATIAATAPAELHEAQGILDLHHLAVEIDLRLKEVSRNFHV